MKATCLILTLIASLSSNVWSAAESDLFATLAENLISTIPAGKDNIRLGVGDFFYQDTDMMSPFSSKLREEMEMKLTKSNGIEVVTRNRIADLENEIRFQKDYDIVDPGTPVENLQIKGIEGIVRGRFYVEGESVVVYTEIAWLQGGKVDKTKTVCPLKDFAQIIYPGKKQDFDQLKTEWIVPRNAEASQQGIEEIRHQNLFKTKHQIGLKLRTSDGEKIYKEGDTISFRVKADQDCHIVVVCHQHDGTSVVLFPNQWHQNTFIKAEQNIEVPDSQKSGFEIEIGEPFGSDIVQVIACTDENALHSEIKNMVSGTKKDQPYAVSTRGMFPKKIDEALQKTKSENTRWGEKNIIINTYPIKK